MRALLAKVHGARHARSLVRRERGEGRAREHARIRTKRRKPGVGGERNTHVRMHTMTREADEHTRIRAEKEVEKLALAQEGAERESICACRQVKEEANPKHARITCKGARGKAS